MASSKTELKLSGTTLFNGKFYKSGDEGKLSAEDQEAIQKHLNGHGRRPMPRSYVSSGQEATQHPMDSGGPDPAEAVEESAPKRARGRRGSGE